MALEVVGDEWKDYIFFAFSSYILQLGSKIFEAFFEGQKINHWK